MLKNMKAITTCTTPRHPTRHGVQSRREQERQDNPTGDQRQRRTEEPESLHRDQAPRDHRPEAGHGQPDRDPTPNARSVNPSPIRRVYVIDSGVALYGGIPLDLCTPDERPLAMASSRFLSRAAYHGAELHVPSGFYSEVTTLVWQHFVTTGVIRLEDATILLEDVLSTDWQMHIAVFGEVLKVLSALGRTGGTGVAEYLALAANLECEFVTTDELLAEEVQARDLEIAVVLVTAHPWATPGALDDHPPEQ